MTPIATYELPLPPTGNHSYTPIRGRFISKKTHRQFKQDAALLLANQYQLWSKEDRDAFRRTIKSIKRNGWFLYLEVFFFLDNVLSRDEDGGLKVVQDSVCKHIGIDDKYVMDAHIGKRRANGRPRCEIYVYLYEEKAG